MKLPQDTAAPTKAQRTYIPTYLLGIVQNSTLGMYVHSRQACMGTQ